ncbi:hypothetical protein SAMN05216303_102326 [Rhodoferax sp. OV413]|uniref:hypothetical protein n=1 Tax=Rhodoferax sp. OV413 TaxID=1855285 RepID=UPI00088383F0|nr:hypothetical protein [Rhodoferax sp. OV413]SDO77645.1 hypothetical protein SAMN05216303_102326 [Rhodoferax sp. OV413]
MPTDDTLAIIFCTLTVVSAVGILLMFAPLVQYIAALFGLLALSLLAAPYAPGWGFGAAVISSFGWTLFGLQHRMYGLITQMSALLLFSLVGLWNWWLGPLVLG